MRILHLAKYFPPVDGGMERFLAGLRQAQRQQGLAVATLVHGSARGNVLSAAQSQDEAWSGPAPVWRSRSYGELAFTPLAPGFRRDVQRLLQHWRPELLHVHLPNPSAFWLLSLPQARALPWVLHWHADVPFDAQDWRIKCGYPLYRRWEHAMLRQAAKVIVTSPPYLEHSPTLQAWRDKCQVIPLALDPATMLTVSPAQHTEATARWPQAQGLKVLHVGRLSYYKGHELLLQALAAAPRAQLLCVGDGPLRRRLEQRRLKLGLQDRMQFTGHLDDASLAALLASCDVLVLPSIERSEAFGMVLLEAMHYGKPVWVSDLAGSGMRWVVQHPDTGWVLRNQDLQAWAAALQHVAPGAALLQAQGLAGQQRLQQFFHLQPVSTQILALYRELVPAPAAGEPA